MKMRTAAFHQKPLLLSDVILEFCLCLCPNVHAYTCMHAGIYTHMHAHVHIICIKEQIPLFPWTCWHCISYPDSNKNLTALYMQLGSLNRLIYSSDTRWTQFQTRSSCLKLTTWVLRMEVQHRQPTRKGWQDRTAWREHKTPPSLRTRHWGHLTAQHPFCEMQ